MFAAMAPHFAHYVGLVAELMAGAYADADASRAHPNLTIVQEASEYSKRMWNCYQAPVRFVMDLVTLEALVERYRQRGSGS